MQSTYIAEKSRPNRRRPKAAFSVAWRPKNVSKSGSPSGSKLSPAAGNGLLLANAVAAEVPVAPGLCDAEGAAKNKEPVPVTNTELKVADISCTESR